MKNIFGILILLFASGCGESPLLNHTEKQKTVSANETRSCDLSFETSHLCGTVTWIRGPVKSKAEDGNILEVEFLDSMTHESRAMSAEDFSVMPWMPSMGHGPGSRTVKVKNILDLNGTPVPGAFRLSNIAFTMSGKWELWFVLKSGEKAKLEVSV